MNKIKNSVNTVLEEKLIVVLRGIKSEQLSDVIDALYDGGVRVAEVAFNPKDKSSFIKTAEQVEFLREKTDGKMIIGAGTCVSTEIFDYALSAGAQIIVSPDANFEIIDLTKSNNLISMPGAFTPSECTSAWRRGADIVKLFPYTVNDIGMIKNITVPLNYIPFFSFGGVNENTIEKFFECGVSGVGTGISILKKELLEEKKYDEIRRLALLHTEAIKSI